MDRQINIRSFFLGFDDIDILQEFSRGVVERVKEFFSVSCSPGKNHSKFRAQECTFQVLAGIQPADVEPGDLEGRL